VAETSSKVLVVLPTLGDRVSQLELALESVELQRGEVELTLVVVVPPDAKEARTLAKKFGAVVIEDPGKGMSAAINAGIEARTLEDFYIWLGDDDSYRPGGLKSLVQAMKTHPHATVAFGACDYVGDGEVLWTSRAGAWASRLVGLGPNLIPHPAALIRLDSLIAIGGYDEKLTMVMDLDLFLRLRRVGEFVSTPETVSAFGWHPDSLTVSDRRKSAAEARMVKRRYLPRWALLFEPLWEYPVQWASALAARRLSRRRNTAANS